MERAQEPLIDRAVLTAARAERGEQFADDLAYFIEDGAKAIAQIEQAARAHDAHGVVRPAHGLKNDARALGALPLAGLASEIEAAAYGAVKAHTPLAGVDALVALLPGLFAQTVKALRTEIGEKSSIRRVVSIGIKAMTER